MRGSRTVPARQGQPQRSGRRAIVRTAGLAVLSGAMAAVGGLIVNGLGHWIGL